MNSWSQGKCKNYHIFYYKNKTTLNLTNLKWFWRISILLCSCDYISFDYKLWKILGFLFTNCKKARIKIKLLTLIDRVLFCSANLIQITTFVTRNRKIKLPCKEFPFFVFKSTMRFFPYVYHIIFKFSIVLI